VIASASWRPAPTDEQVTTFYTERKGAFRAPEYRSVNLLVLDPARCRRS
jgi:peptidyl-prolyl cis-trans isomerase D